MNWQKYSNDVKTFMLRLVLTEGQGTLNSPRRFTSHYIHNKNITHTSTHHCNAEFIHFNIVTFT